MQLKKVTTGEFCVATLILKTEENTQCFWHIMLCYFKKGKNATEIQKKISAVRGRAVTDQMCQSGLLEIFVLAISRCTMLHR